MPVSELLRLARRVDAERARALEARLSGRASDEAVATAVLLGTAYPALAGPAEREVEALPAPVARSRGEIERELDGAGEGAAFRRALRRVAARERLRIALRELLPVALGGADLEDTAREISELAEVTLEAALAEAAAHVAGKLGPIRHDDGRPGSLVVLGMGKLGGRELNAGSDVDLICFHDSDATRARGGGDRETSAHDFWARVVRRMTETLEEATEDGLVWRVDHRLRPEGARGSLVNSLAAAERYYESFGRLWERAALSRARPVAGDLDLGRRILEALAPFVWARRVDPTIAASLFELVHRARAESGASERDLKLGPGGIREAEFFVQALQLIWGGRDARVRSTSTLEAAARLRAAGLVTEREHDELTAAYVALRRTEHAVQWSTGVQTHSLPRAQGELGRLARALGHDDADALRAELELHRGRVAALFSSLLPAAARPSRWAEVLGALDRQQPDELERALAAARVPGLGAEDDQLARDLYEAARLHPDGPLGSRTRERHPALVEALLDALADAADPPQAARYFRRFCARLSPPSVYTKLLADDVTAARRLVAALGGSVFVGEAVANHPELGDLVLFARGAPSADEARAEMLAAQGEDEDPVESITAGLRRAKHRITTQVALADLAGEIDAREATRILSALADGALEAATRFALGHRGGLAVMAMGKLGGCEAGYGSDLDVFFLYDAGAAPQGTDDPQAYFTRKARQVIQILTLPHHEGPGWELDTRLRPSGSQGLLVSSLEGFARYHDVPLRKDDGTAPSARGARAATWERLALLRGRFAAGDARLGAEAMRVARAATFRGGALGDLARDVHHVRARMEVELAKERPGRHDLKMGRGGLVDVEFVVQLLQLVHGHEHDALRTADTREALAALDESGLLGARAARSLREGYDFLRRLELRIRILHADSSHLLEEDAPGLVPLARRMGFRQRTPAAAARRMMAQYRAVTERVRKVYESVVVAAVGEGA
jgi:glutamate-ammonia-ligase adenylyltransferase